MAAFRGAKLCFGRRIIMRPLEGIIIPAVTPFDENGDLRLDYLKHNYELWNTTCVQGYMALGSNGEFRSLDDDEAFSVLKTASEATAETSSQTCSSSSGPGDGSAAEDGLCLSADAQLFQGPDDG